jgi:hypothetical protein
LIDLNKSVYRAARRPVSLTRLRRIGSSLVVGKSHLEVSALEGIAAELIDRRSCVTLRAHLDEAGASRIALVVVQQSGPDGLKLELAEEVEDVLLVRRVLEVAHQDGGALGGTGPLADHGRVGASEIGSGSRPNVASGREVTAASLEALAIVHVFSAAAAKVATAWGAIATFTAGAIPPGRLSVAISAEAAAATIITAVLASASSATSTAAAAPAATAGASSIAIVATTVAAAASAAATIATATTAVRASSVAIATALGPALVSPVTAEAVFLEFRHLSALANVEVDVVLGLGDPLEVLHEGFEDLSTDVEHDAAAAAQGPHALDLLGGARVPVFLQDRICGTVAETASLHRRRHDGTGHALLPVEDGLRRELLPVVAAAVGKDNLKCLLSVALVAPDEVLGQVFEEVEHVLVDILEVLKNAGLRGLDDVFSLRDADSLELDTGLVFDFRHKLIRLLRVEGDAGAGLAGAGGTPRPVNVGLSVFGRLDLDDEINVRDVEASRCHIGSDKHLELALLEALDRDLALVLDDVAVHDFHVLLDLVGEDELVGVLLRLGKDNSFCALSVANERVSESRESVLVRALDGEVLHLPGGLVLQVLRKIDNLEARLHVLTCDASNPAGDGSREKAELDWFFAGLSDVFQDRVHVLLKAELEHLVRLIEDDCLEVGEIDVAALDVIKDATGGSDKNFNAMSELARLVFNADTAVHGKNFEFVMPVLYFFELCGNLQCELSGRRQDDRLNAARAKVPLLAEEFDDWETEGKGLARTGQISRDNVVALVNRVEAVLLDGEQVDVTLRSQLFDRLRWDLRERGKLAIFRRFLGRRLGAHLTGLLRQNLEFTDVVIVRVVIGCYKIVILVRHLLPKPAGFTPLGTAVG